MKYTAKEIGMDIYQKLNPAKSVIDHNGKRRWVYYFCPKQKDCFSKTGNLIGVIDCDLKWEDDLC